MNITSETVEIIREHRLPSYNEIPDVGLYLEQVTKYINGYLKPIMDTTITGSMISNYVKKKLIANPVKKLYYRDHIAQIIITGIIKSVISLDKVKLIQQIDGSAITKESYNSFVKTFNYALKKVFDFETEPVDLAENSDYDRLLSDIVNTVVHKIYIDKLLTALE